MSGTKYEEKIGCRISHMAGGLDMTSEYSSLEVLGLIIRRRSAPLGGSCGVLGASSCARPRTSNHFCSAKDLVRFRTRNNLKTDQKVGF